MEDFKPVDMTYKEILEGTAELLSDPDKWCKGSYAQDKYENTRVGLDPDAIKFCVLGAIQKVSNTMDHIWSPLSDLLEKQIDEHSIVEFNDDINTTHEDIMLVLKKAIYSLEDE